MKGKCLTGILSLLLAVGLLLPLSAGKAAAEPENLQEQVNQLIKMVEEQGKQIKAQQKNIEELRAQNASGRQQPAKPLPPKTAPTTAKTAAKPVGQPPQEAEPKNIPEITSLFAQPGVLTPKGSWVVEPSFQYSNSSNTRVALAAATIIPAIAIGDIDVRSVTSDTFVAAITTRYGVTDRLEAELRVPYIYRQDSSTERPLAILAEDDKVFSLNDHGLGDIEFGLRYQLNQPVSGPYYVAGLRVKSDTGQGPFDIAQSASVQERTELPTGSGAWGIQPSLTVMYPSDPAVFYGSIDYMWTIEESVGGTYSKYNPGDIYGFNVGMGLALNDKASISFGYDHSVVGRARLDGKIQPGVSTTHVGSFFVGGSHKLTESTSFNLSVGMGATEFAPDVQVTTSIAVSY